MDALWLKGADRLQRLFPDSNTTIKQYYLERMIPILAGLYKLAAAKRENSSAECGWNAIWVCMS
jgi:hypothetical protein